MGLKPADKGFIIKKTSADDRVVALAGNPNVGKSTVFNALTGLRQHTGNWPGKTVTNAQGYCEFGGRGYVMADLPGCYSLAAQSSDEEAARDFIRGGGADAIVVVCDATCLERNLILALQILGITDRVVVCVNLMDEAKKKKIHIDLTALSAKLGIPAVGVTARSGKGLETLMKAVEGIIDGSYALNPVDTGDGSTASLIQAAEDIRAAAVRCENTRPDARDRALDKILAGRRTAFPVMLLLLMAVFWITLTGANVPSRLISTGLFWLEERLLEFSIRIGTPELLYELLILGVYRVLAWVVSVMLPPMAIFFPLFTLLEDSGYLPRIAFNLDKIFKKCSACGKQALTMCMGFGCNAAGVMGCRIIDSPRERLIAIITNNFVPCNGRFPTLIAIITMFFIGASGGLGQSALSALLLTGVIMLGVGMTFAASRLLSATILKGVPSSFTLELPPYRRPQIGKVIVRSVFDRTLFVLGRAVAVAAPAGLVIWVTANVTVGDATLLSHCAGFLDPFGRLMGMDGVILLAFILGLPANEIVIPIIIMAYMARGSILDVADLTVLRVLLVENGWTWVTAVSVMLFSLMHWPCSTTGLTIKKETRDMKWTAVAYAVPTLIGMFMCFVFANIARIFA